MLSLAHAGTAIASAFVASLVEAVEALTIVLAVGTVRGWQPALAGTVAGLAFLALLVLAFGPLLARMPIEYLQLAVGVLLLLFGMRWLRKAILRAAGVIALHDEALAFADGCAALRAAHPRRCARRIRGAAGTRSRSSRRSRRWCSRGSRWFSSCSRWAPSAACWCPRAWARWSRSPAARCTGRSRGSRKTRSSSPWAYSSRRSARSGSARAWGSTGPGTISRFSASPRCFSPPRPPPRRSRAGRAPDEMSRHRRPGDRRAVRRGRGLHALHPGVGRACRARAARAPRRRAVARGDFPRRLPCAPRRECPARGAQARGLTLTAILPGIGVKSSLCAGIAAALLSSGIAVSPADA